jgi:hypothetical protein
MISSDGFGGRGTTAGTRIQVGATIQTQAGTVLPAQQEPGGRCQGELLANDIADVYVRRPFQQRIEVGVVGRVRISTEHCGIDVDVHISLDIGQASSALAVHGSVDAASPQILSGAGCLQLPGYRYRSHQVEIQSVKGGIIRP